MQPGQCAGLTDDDLDQPRAGGRRRAACRAVRLFDLVVGRRVGWADYTAVVAVMRDVLCIRKKHRADLLEDGGHGIGRAQRDEATWQVLRQRSHCLHGPATSGVSPAPSAACQAWESALRSLQGVFAPQSLAGLSVPSGGLSAGAAGVMVKNVAEMGREIDKLSQISGASTDEFQRLAFGASDCGHRAGQARRHLQGHASDKVGEFRHRRRAARLFVIAPKVGVTAQASATCRARRRCNFTDSLQKAGA